ncbi:GNAT family N-acetyltransferase [Oscillochloris sp. ZM17-4]|uniref:GNAT family N-acetyltransferase n=1 Tax=Oscillochloris sp. ZM17-4 TaxID=2866714 RepID=UPI001C73E057|nr:GNAT family N-acetyltransferase [Oscillochloris sp. ZM17-4]MBX0329172.1 GNAT family N-acetyltransferase [Oscillochloris sp. ZM17-4]
MGIYGTLSSTGSWLSPPNLQLPTPTPMNLTHRPFSDDDMPRVQAAVSGWIRDAGVCGYGHIGYLPHRIYAILRGRAAGDLVRVWEDGDQVAGVAVCGMFDAAFDVLACPACRGGAIEVAMLEDAAALTLRAVRSLDPARAEVITDVYGCDTIRRRLLAQIGFTQYRQWDDIAERDLSARIADAPAPAGFTIRPARSDDAAGLAVARNDTFDDSWTAAQYREMAARLPGQLPEREIVAVAPDGRIAAFAVLWLDQVNRTGLFEPVGVAPAFRRLGLARAVMTGAMGELRRLGAETAVISYDATNLAARALYRSLGFQKTGETLGYRRG